MYDVVIIGGGVVGCMTARELSRYRLRVAVLEAENDVSVGASKANSAIVHAGFDAPVGSEKARLNVRGCAQMPQVCQELGVPYRQNGSLVLAFSKAEEEHLHLLLNRGEVNGVPDLRLLNRRELLSIEPHIGEGATAALYAPNAGIVCPYGLAIAAMGNAMDNGAELYTLHRVIAIERRAVGFRVVTPSRTFDAKRVINAAGIKADIIARLVGDTSFTITPRRGEYLLLDKTCGKLVSHTLFRTPTGMGKGILVTPTVDGNLLLGPTAENIEDRGDTATTAQGLDTVRTQASDYVIGLDLSQTITAFSGLRAVGSSGDFIFTTPVSGFFNAAGIESPGLTASPAIAEMLVELLRKDGMPLIPNPHFNPYRPPMHAFSEASWEEKNALIATDPTYGNIVCRCEGITEGEIRAVLRKHPKPTDVDGVKRRTRVRMGRCQGGFCTPRVLEIMAQEWSCSPLELTQSGGDSGILKGEL